MSGIPWQPAVAATDIPVRPNASAYPEPFASRVTGRSKRQLGNAFGLTNIGVNLTELAPGSESALMHRHTKQDEFIYILEGNPTLATENGSETLSPGMCAGFPAGGAAHHVINNTDRLVRYIEIGDRTPGDEGHYPKDDLRAVMENGSWAFRHKDGQPYD
tara:strand:- start:1655 stop:2134 length:480 start_codon:yes stop_codon:yes gene_type:complete